MTAPGAEISGRDGKDLKIMKLDLEKLIGNTPFVELKLDFLPGVKLWVKMESFNLTGSIKDRMADFMIKKARSEGLLKNGGVIVEATNGNTGISFAALAAHFGYKMIAVMPEGMTSERVKMMTAYGAKVVLSSRRSGVAGAIKTRNRIAKEIKNSWIPGQFSNRDNVEAHRLGIAREIINDLRLPKGFKTPGVEEQIDYFIHGVGTGGTLMGIAEVFKKERPDVKIIAVEPAESAVLSGGKAGDHDIPGIGEGFIPKIVNPKLIDEAIQVSSRQAMEKTKALAKSGFLVGISSGANIAAIEKLTKRSKKRLTILTIFADRGERYLSNTFFGISFQ